MIPDTKNHTELYSHDTLVEIDMLFCVFSELLLDGNVERVSTCELEIDIVAADILNRLEVGGKLHLLLCDKLYLLISSKYHLLFRGRKQ